MHNLTRTFITALAISAISVPAFAGPPNLGGRGKAGSSISRSVRDGGGGNFSRGSSSRGGSHSRSRGGDLGLGRGLGGGSDTPILDALRGASGGNSKIGDGQLLRELGRRYEENRWYEDRREREDNYHDAQRDAMIANAVVSVVGIIADAQTRKYAQPAYIAAPPAPAPVYAPAPAGHYEARRTVVQEGYYATERVWVPEFRDSSGAIVEGHYENHRRWVPPVYQETEVWVQH